jgi:hypothetical protein
VWRWSRGAAVPSLSVMDMASAAGAAGSGTQAPWPRVSACSGRGSPGSARQLSPWAQRAVATPQAAPSGRAHIGQQPQPAGLESSRHEAGTSGQSASFSAEQGAQRQGWEELEATPTWTASRSRTGQVPAVGTTGIAKRGRQAVDDALWAGGGGAW